MPLKTPPMKFNDIPYLRPDISAFENAFKSLLHDFENAASYEVQNANFLKIFRLRDEFDTMYQLANIKYTTNTADESFQKEVDFFNDAMPSVEDLIDQFYRTIIHATFRKELEQKWGKFIFDLATYKIKGFDPIIIEELKEENKLKSEYTKLKGTAKIEYYGETYNLAGIGKFLDDKDRTVRKESSAARWQFFADHQTQFDTVFDQLVHLRHNMAQKLGYEDFINLGYIRMNRIDYNRKMVADFRQQIVDFIVPLTQRLRAKQKKRLGIEALKEYDLNYNFDSGNPRPKGTPEEILNKAKIMYDELSPETSAFFNYMLDHDLLDVINRPGKADMGYCWELSTYKHPFIFANFNGTSHDIDVLTHEAGHAFQYFSSRNTEIIEYKWPSSEACEIHSMSMEFLTYPWMESFFEEQTGKYFFAHLEKSLLFLPYGCAVDHFQHIIYEQPNLTPDERAEVWKDMQKLYLPDNEYDTIPYLTTGRFWQKQGHIFESPFYYIDYVLAQICAFQFWLKNQEDKAGTWKNYLTLCQAGGKAPFLSLVELANLTSPFEDGCVRSVAQKIEDYLNTIDDTKF
jgi:M3 family oligoendopeptidase